MTEKIKIDIISDVVCPWCIIGYGNLTRAITELGLDDRVEIEWQPFELNPDMPQEGEELRAHSARKYGSTPEDSARFREEMSARGKELDFEFNYFEGMKIVNTRDAHVLLEYAKDKQLQSALKLRLFAAFFSEKKDVSQRSVLIAEAVCVGLDEQAVIDRLADESAHQHVVDTESQWQQMGVSSVPTVVFNRNSALAGAHPIETFVQVLSELK